MLGAMPSFNFALCLWVSDQTVDTGLSTAVTVTIAFAPAAVVVVAEDTVMTY